MRFHTETEWECPRCRLAATPVAARRGRCTHCDAELVSARGPSEEWIRAYLYGDDRAGRRVRSFEPTGVRSFEPPEVVPR